MTSPLTEQCLRRRAPISRSLVKCELFAESSSRRLLKARHQEFEQLHIRTAVIAQPQEQEDRVAPITLYLMQIVHASLSSRDHEQRGQWVVCRPFSEFWHFRRALLEQIKAWEASLSVQEKQEKEFIAMSNSLRRAFGNDFPRKHIRIDTPAIIAERRVGLQDFLQRLLTVYADASIYIEHSRRANDVSHRHMTAMCAAISEFLNVPPWQKELEAMQTVAVMALSDVDEHEMALNPEDSGYKCCICMNDDDEEATASVRLLGEDKLVRLPCSHHFHEDCILDWFSTSMTCPLCRNSVISGS
ncbi:hypothetical protein ATCC90586_002887 [Pythium insidiosum]|nr:hypothetical protein ATCC90586_002887 [Pythium insidiosum]